MTLFFVIMSLILVVLPTSVAMRHQELQLPVADGKALEVSVQLPKKAHLHDCYQISSRCRSHRFNSINNLEEMKSSLEHCCVIEGDLQLLRLEKHQSWDNVTFPRLVEITGFLLVFRVYNLKSLGSLFPNLATIRGLTTHQGYSLIIYDNRDLQEVGLYNLHSILNGYVRIQNNIQLCFGDDTTINWNQICKAQDSMKGNHFSDNYGMISILCPPCDKSCNGYCWSTTKCQTQCNESCSGNCIPSTGECCHEQCAGGCTKPGNSKSCISCKNYNNYVENVCVETCPERPFYRKLHDYLCINETECDNKKGYKFFDQGGECVKECPPGYSVNGKICKKCERNNDCGKPCKSQLVNTIEKAQTLIGCTTVNGTLVIRITGGREIAEKLENALGNIERVTGYIRIFNSKSLLSLNFFKSLTYIGGETLSRDKYALYVHDNDNLENIWENRNTELNITKGKIFFHSNPKLCYRYVEKLLNNTNLTMEKDKEFMKSLKEDKDFMRSLNGQKVVCNNRNLSLNAVPLHETGAVKLTWETISTQDHRALIGYIIYYRQASETRNLTRYGGRDACSQKWSSILIDGSTAKSTEDYTLRGLTPATLYGIYIHTETLASADKAAWTNIQYVKTVPSNPGEVEDLKTIKAKETSLEISWFPPRQPNGAIQFYIITVTEKDWPNWTIRSDEKNCPNYPDQHKQGSNTDNTELQVNSTVKEKFQDEIIDEEKHDISGNFNDKGNEDQGCCQCSSSNVDTREQAIDFEDDLITLVYYKNREFQRQRRDVWLPQSVEYMKPSTNFIKKKFTRVKRDKTEGDGIDRPECSVPKTNLALQNHSSCENGCRIKTEKTKFTIDNLQYSTRYYLTVEACQKINVSCSLCTKLPKTHNTATSPKMNADLVQDLNISPINEELINVTWKAPKYPNAPIIRYKLQVSNMENTNEVEFWCVNSSISSESYNVKNGRLKPGLHYRIQVEALLSQKQYQSYQQYQANRTFIVPGPLNAQNDRSLLVMGIGASALAFLCLVLYVIWRWGLLHPYKDTKHGKHLEFDYTVNDNYGELLIIIDSKGGIDEYTGDEVPGHSAYMAIQNDPSTYWYPSGLEKNYNNWFIIFNFKDIYRVSTINLQNYGDTIHDVKEFKLETSNDHSNWSIVYSDDNVRTGTKEIQKFRTCSTTCGQYWKFTVKATASGETPRLVLVNFYGAHISHNMNWVEILRGNIDSMYIHDRDKLVLDEKKLGEGHFGVVRKGILKWKGKEVEVAVKQLTDFHEREKLIQEAKIMLGLECNHVVRTYGVVPEGFGLYLVMDLMIRGDLLKYLQSRRAEDNNIFTELTLDRVCDMAVQISDGMAYLAFKKIVHRDLAARNCLLDEKENVKISDFGMTRIVSNYYRIQAPSKFPVRWMPPEFLQNSYFTSQSDVWSYGIVVWEIITGGCRPYTGRGDDDVISYIKQGGTLLSDLPEDSPEFLVNLVSRCWAFSEKCRPSFPEIIFELLPYTSPFFQQYFRGPGMSFYHSSEGRDHKTKIEEAAMLNSQCCESCSGPTTPLTATSRLGTSGPPVLPPRNNARHSLHSDMNSYPIECPSDDDTFNDLPYDTDYDSSAYVQKGHVMVRLDHSTSDGTTSSTFRPKYFADTES